MEKQILKTSGFVSRGYNEGRRSRKSIGLSERKSAKSPAPGAWALLLRLGVCAAAFIAVLGIKLKGRDAIVAVMGGASENEEEGTKLDETLGRLRFVELPSIIEVFAPSKTAVMPVSALGYESTGDDGGIRVSVLRSSEIASPVKGRIKAVGEDLELGRYVSIVSDEDVEFAVYGLGEVSVEEGQPVSQRQRLGTSAGDEVVVRAWKSGRPIDIAGLFGLGAGA